MRNRTIAAGLRQRRSGAAYRGRVHSRAAERIRARDLLDRRAGCRHRRPRGRHPVEVPRGRRGRAVGARRRRRDRDAVVRERAATAPMGSTPSRRAGPRPTALGHWWPATRCASSARPESWIGTGTPRPTPGGSASPGPAAGRAAATRPRATSSRGRAVVDGIAETFEAGGTPFPELLVACLAAAEAAGGDRRGRESAALY